VLQMGDQESIRRLHYVKGHSIKQIARELEISRNTVREVLRGEHDGRYTLGQGRSQPVIGPHLARIRGWLEEEKEEEVWHKQRLTAARIYKLLKEKHGYEGSEPSVRRAVAQLRQELGLPMKEAFVPLSYEPGVDAQVDFFEADVWLGATRCRLTFLLVRACYSGWVFLRRVPAQNQEALLEALVASFEYYGGVFHYLWFDNLSAAVDRVLRGRERAVHERFEDFRQHHAFEAEWCAAGKGNEKGGVEQGLKNVRREALSPVPHVRDVTELDENVVAWLEAQKKRAGRRGEPPARVLWAEEVGRLIPLPAHPFDTARVAQRHVSRYSLVCLDTNHYSVPTTMVGTWATVKCYGERIEVHGPRGCMAVHPRLYGRSRASFELQHYLPLLMSKTRAFDRAAPVRAARSEWPPAYELLLRLLRQREGEVEGTREFICVLMLHRSHPVQRMHEAVRRAVTHAEPSAATVAAYADALRRAEQPTEVLSQKTLERYPEVRVDAGQVAQYTRLCKGRRP
jgi:transposase